MSTTAPETAPRAARSRRRSVGGGAGDEKKRARSKSPRRRRRRSAAPPMAVHWSHEQHVDDVHLTFLYTPHTLLALGATLLTLFTLAFTIDLEANDTMFNTRLGVSVAIAFFLILGTLVFPSGPFIRPHPLVWRVAFGAGVLYEVFLIFILFQKREDGRAVFKIFDESYGEELIEKPYAGVCDLSWVHMKDKVLDIFVLAHFCGWMAKALVLRDTVLLIVMSVTWEFVELGFVHMLPNFAECWWDQAVLDVLLANGLGIYCGLKLNKYLESKEYKWNSYSDLPSVTGKLGRVVMQFTPERWMKDVRWESTKSLKRFAAVTGLMFLYLLQDLNAFFLKHVLYVPSESAVNPWRLVLYFFIGMPATRQAYVYLTDKTCKRFGTFSWLTITCLITELMVIFRYSKGMFPNAFEPDNTHLWLPYTVVLVLGLLAFVVRVGRRSRSGSVAAEEGAKEE